MYNYTIIMQSKPFLALIKKLRTFLFLISFFALAPTTVFSQISVPQWVDDLGGPGSSSSVPAAVKVDKQNNVYVTGIFQGTVDFDPSSGTHNLTSVGGSFDTYVAKFTSAGKLIWVVSFGGTGTDQVNSLGIDDNGNPSVTGQYDSQSMDIDPGSGITTLQNNGDKDGFIVKFDTNGKFLWGKSIGGFDTDYGDKVIGDHAGNTIAMVQYQSTINIEGRTFSSAGSTFNGLMIKYDPNGNVLWAVNWSDSGDSEGRYMAVDANNNILVDGVFDNAVNFNPLGGAVNLNGNGGSLFVGKYTPDGKLTWIKQVAGQAVNNNLNLCVDSKGNVFIDGPLSSTLTFNGNTTINPVSSQDIFIAKYNANGDFQVVKDIGAAGSSAYNYGIVASSKDEIYISGFFSGTVDFDPSPYFCGTNFRSRATRSFFIEI